MLKIKFIGTILKPSSDKIDKASQLSKNKTINDILTELGYSKEHQKFIVVTSNGRKISCNDSVGNFEEITLTVTVGGG